MLFLASLVSVLLPLRVLAQTPSGFSPGAGASLGAVFTSSNTTISPAGILIPRADTISPPELFAPTSGPEAANQTYMVFMIDLDVPINSSAPNATRETLLHWFQPNLISNMVHVNITSPPNVLVSNNDTSIAGAPYIQPGPPAGSGPHRYTLLLFAQPANFAVPSAFASIDPPANTSARIGFNITTFMKDAKLDAPVAGNFFQVLNGTSAQTSSVTMSFPLATGSVTTTAASLTETTPSATSGGASGTASASSSAAAGSVGKEMGLAGAMGVIGAAMWML